MQYLFMANMRVELEITDKGNLNNAYFIKKFNKRVN